MVQTDIIVSMHSCMRDDDKTVDDQPQETWLDHVHTSGQILLLLITCFFVLFSILSSGIESGTLVGTLVALAWCFLAIGWWLVYRLLYAVISPRSESPPP